MAACPAHGSSADRRAIARPLGLTGASGPRAPFTVMPALIAPLDSAPVTRHSGAKIEGEPRSMFATSMSVTTCARMRAGPLSPPFSPCRPA